MRLMGVSCKESPLAELSIRRVNAKTVVSKTYTMKCIALRWLRAVRGDEPLTYYEAGYWML
jgi:hypothetical protein